MKISLTILAVVVSALPVSAQRPVGVSWVDSTSVRLAFTLAEGDSIGSDYAVTSVPVLTNGRGDTLRLEPAVFRGKRNRRYIGRMRYYGMAGDTPQGREARLGTTVDYDVTLQRADCPWLWDGVVSLDAERTKSGCCDVMPAPTVPLARFVYVPPFEPLMADVPDNTGRAGQLERDNPVLQHISKYRPYDDTRILRKEKGALYVHFPLDKAVLSTSFRDNGPTLDRIVSITRDIMADTTSSVKIIQIIGLASVEGPVARNRALAGNRAQALKRYIQGRVAVPDSLFECVNGGEAWTELRDQIADGSFDGRDRLLQIIDTEADPNRRETLMRRLDGGRPYAYLRDNVLSDQRNSGYLRIYYDYVPDTRAKTINEATGLMRRGLYDVALRSLLTVKDDPRSWNAIGVALYMTGDEQQAFGYFEKAAAQGDARAQQNLDRANATTRAAKLESSITAGAGDM